MHFDHAIYHGGCMDGFTAAFLLWERFGCEVHAGRYGDEPPDVSGQVCIADFSYPRDQIIELAERVEKITILDHHQTAQEHLVDLPSNVDVVLDMSRSGAMITFEYLYPNEPAPPLVEYVQDRDLWKYELPHSHEIGAYISSVPMTWTDWDAMDSLLEAHFEHALAGGTAILRRDEILINQILPTARYFEIGGQQVKAAACPYGLGSEVAGRLARESSFGSYYIDYPDRREFGLRSGPEGLDVAKVAEIYGGGGHKHASGFRIVRDTLTQLRLLN